MPGKGKEKEKETPKINPKKFINDFEDLNKAHTKYKYQYLSSDNQQYDLNSKIWKKDGKQMQKEVASLNNGPNGRDPMSMMSWLLEWKMIYDRGDVLEQYDVKYDSELLSMGLQWKRVFDDKQARDVLLNGGDPSQIKNEATKKQYTQFLSQYTAWAGPEQQIEEPKQPAPAETRPAPQPVQTQQSQPAPQPAPVKAEPVQDTRNYYREDKASLDTLIQKLKDAKTFYNSSAYKNIINVAEMLNKFEKLPATLGGKKVEGLENLDKKQQHAYKMFAIRDMVDKYLNHKAEEGVKQNVYGKLAAVEELHQFVSQRIRDLAPAPFEVGGKQYDSKKVTVTFAEDERLVYDDAFVNSDDRRRLTLYNEKDWEGLAFKASLRHNVEVDPKEGLRVSDCMGRIIRKAENKRAERQRENDIVTDVGKTAEFSDPSIADNIRISNLEAMRKQFTEKPFSYEKPAQKTMQQTAAKKSNGPQLS